MGAFAARLQKVSSFLIVPINGVVVGQKNNFPYFCCFRRDGGLKIDCARIFVRPTSIWMLGINAYGRFINANLNSSAYKKVSADRPIFLLLYS